MTIAFGRATVPIMNFPWSRFTALLAITLASLILQSALADGGDGDDYYNDDGGQADEASSYYDIESNSGYDQESDSVKYWTDFAILPKRCIS